MRSGVLKDIRETLGIVPGFFEELPDEVLSQEWELMKQVQMGPGAIGLKERQLLGIGISAAMRCHYCSLFHTELARALGATEKEIGEALLFAKLSAGWSTYLNGSRYDYERFRFEVGQIADHVRKVVKAGAAV